MKHRWANRWSNKDAQAARIMRDLKPAMRCEKERELDELRDEVQRLKQIKQEMENLRR